MPCESATGASSGFVHASNEVTVTTYVLLDLTRSRIAGDALWSHLAHQHSMLQGYLGAANCIRVFADIWTLRLHSRAAGRQTTAGREVCASSSVYNQKLSGTYIHTPSCQAPTFIHLYSYTYIHLIRPHSTWTGVQAGQQAVRCISGRWRAGWA